MKEHDELTWAITALEGQRATLGDRVVDAALATLREKLASLEEYAPASRQRRLVTVLFLDIANSVSLSQGLEPEEVQAVVGSTLRRLAAPVEAHGGQVIQFMGDGFMATFGLKRTHENDARQAVRAGLAILGEAHNCALELEQQHHLPGFNVRIGVHTGRVVAGRFSQAESPVMGLTVSLASRVEEAALPGSVFISQFTYPHVRGAFEVQALEPIMAKGFPQPVTVYHVQAARPRTFRTFTRGVEGIETRLVGREDELAQLQAAFTHAVQDRQTTLVTIRGEAGMGKSRLLYEFDRWIAQAPAPVTAFKARVSPQRMDVPFSLLREMVSYRIGALSTDTLDATRRCLVDAFTQVLADEPEMKAHFVGALLGIDFSGSPYLVGLEADLQQLSRRGQLYLSQYLSTVAGECPTIFMLDDIHWADIPSLSFVTQFVRQFPQLPLLVVLLGRPSLAERFPELGQAEVPAVQELPGAQPQPAILHMAIGPLSPRASRELLGEILRNVEPLPAQLSQHILDQAVGNPFYLEEFIQALVDTKVIRPSPGGARWQLDIARLSHLELPGTLIALLEARLDNLSAAHRALLEQAAVIGAVFWRSALQAVQGDRPISNDELELLTRRGFIFTLEPSTFEGTEEYHFHHALLRDVAYQALLKPDRMSHHNKVAGWLIETTQASGRVGEFAPVIAGHYEAAGERLSAAEWFTQSGEHARHQGAPAQARAFFDHALQLLPPEVSASTPAAELSRRWKALAGRDDALGILGETQARLVDDRALVSLAEWIGDDNLVAEAYFRQGYFLSVIGQYPQEREVYLRGLDAARRSNNRRCEALILGLKIFCEVHLGDLVTARQTSKAALKYAEELGDDEVLARNLTNVSIYYTESGDMARSAQMLERQLEINRRTGNLEGEVIGLANIAYVYILLGMPQAAIPLLQRGIQTARDIGMFTFHAYSRLNLGLAHLRSGDALAALSVFDQCLPDLKAMNDIADYASGQTYTALALEQNGQLDEALAGFELAISTMQEIGTVGYIHDAEAGLTRCLLKLQRLEAAQEHTLHLWDHLKQHSGARMEFPVLAYETCADVFSAVGQGRLARRAVGAGYGELLMRAGKISLAEWRRSFLEQVPEHRRIWARWQHLLESNEQNKR